MKRGTLAVLGLTVSAMKLTACAVGPDYVRPTMEIPATFKEAQDWKPAQPADELPKGKWWEVFSDSTLNELEAQVEASNQNIKLAEAHYRQARALVQNARAEYFPTLAADGSVSRGKLRTTSGTAGTRSTTYDLA